MNQPHENLHSDQMATAKLDSTLERLVQEIVDRVVDALDERDDKLLEAKDVASILGRSRTWVYERAELLGAVRMGDGPKARMGFKRSSVNRFLEEQGRLHRKRISDIKGGQEDEEHSPVAEAGNVSLIASGSVGGGVV